MVQVSVTVTNTGSDVDRISIVLNLSALNITDLPHLTLSPRVRPGASQTLDFLWHMPEDIPSGQYNIPVTVTSRYAMDEGINVTAETTLVMIVLPASTGEDGGDDEGESEREIHPILRTCLFLVVLLFVFIILVVLFRRRRALEDEEDAEEMLRELGELLEWYPGEDETAETPAPTETTAPGEGPGAPVTAAPSPPRAAPVSTSLSTSAPSAVPSAVPLGTTDTGGPESPGATVASPLPAAPIDATTGEGSPPRAAAVAGEERPAPPAARRVGP
jgi:hypothetical protein